MPIRAFLMALGMVPLAIGRNDPIHEVKAARAHLDKVTKESQKRALNAIEIQHYQSEKSDLDQQLAETNGAVSVVREMLRGMGDRR